MFLFHLRSWRIFLLEKQPWVDDFSLQCFEEVVPLLSGLCWFWWESSDIENVVLWLQCVLFLWMPSKFSFYLSFQQCDFDGPMCALLFIFSSALHLLNFLNLKINAFFNSWEISSHYFFEYFFCLILFSPSRTPWTHILEGLFFIVFHNSWVSTHLKKMPSSVLQIE